jgi:hypothetical protein
MHTITVEPFGEGWSVALDGAADQQIFHSGRDAERTARVLAARFARVGDLSEIVIYLRDGAQAGRIVYPPAGPASPAPASIPGVRS